MSKIKKPICTGRSPPPIPTLDLASDESKSIYMEQFGRPCTEAPMHGYPIAENAVETIGIDTTAT